jgi:hypothetical protein
MKYRIIGTIFVLAILLVLFVLTGNVQHTSQVSQDNQTVPSNSSDNDLKNLKIQ